MVVLKAGRNLCFGKKYRFLHDDFGFNYRMTNLQAALGVAQVEKIDRTIDRKRWIASQYNKHLNNVSELTLPIEKPWAKNIYWMYAVLLSEKTGLDASQLAKLLKTLIKREFPRSRKVRLHKFSDPGELDRQRKTL